MIVADGVTKHYGTRRALDRVSFTIESGEVVGLLGLNGAGKTTMLKVLCGLLLPTAGQVRVDGVDGLAEPLELRRRIGFLPDRPPLYGELTVRQMLSYAGRLNGVSSSRIAARVDEVLALADLERVADDLIEWLSHGFRQRVGIAQAIVHEPRFVVLDEPISGLDPAQIVAMRGLIRGLAKKHTVLLSSHILGEISQTCDRILVMHQGRIVAQGREDELVGGRAARVEVVARGARDRAWELLQRLDGVADVEIVVDEGLLRIRARVDSDDARERLLAALVGAGIGLRRVQDQHTGLEEVFLSLTNKASGGGLPSSSSSSSSSPVSAESP